jgi:two-component sensor histidine kinase
LVADLWMTYAPQGVTARIEAAGIALDIDTAIPCALLLNELVSNALKHAFPAPASGQENEIRISMRREKESLVLMVSDNGIGLPADLDVENVDSLGLDLVHLLTGQIGGLLEMGRSGGASFKITFPQP